MMRWRADGKALIRHAVRAGCAAAVVAAVASCAQSSPARTSLGAGAWPGAVTVASAWVPGAPPAPGDTAVYTQRGSNSRVGWNDHETVLTTRDVNARDFGRVAAFPVRGKIYSQPLFVPGLRIDGADHNVVIVTTEDDQVYAFDADASGTDPALLWHTSFLVHGATPVPSVTNLHCPFITPSVSITGTPVIDRATDTMYLVTAVTVHGRIVDAVHALNITTGRDRIRPVVIRASVRGTGTGSRHGVLPFDPEIANQHAALLLSHGVVYAAFSGYCGRAPDHGWVLGYDASDLRLAVVYNDTQDSIDGGIWQSATGLVADGAGDIYVTTGNGPFNLASGGSSASDSLLELRRDGGTLKIADYFTPFYQQCMAANDEDFSSGAPLLLPREVISVAKVGAFWVLNRDHLGGYHAIARPCSHLDDTHVDRISQETRPQTVVGGVWGAETYWRGLIYTGGTGDHLSAWRLARGRIKLPAAARAPETLTYPGAIPVGSSDGTRTATAIVWALDDEHGPALRAYAASDLARELWNSQQGPAASRVPAYDNFTLPTVADGRVYLGTSGELLVYGLLDHGRGRHGD